MPTRQSVRQQHIDTIADLSRQAFADHVMTRHHRISGAGGTYASWTCKRPQSSTYAFRVSIEPNTLLVSGDVGCLLIAGGDDLPWLRNALHPGEIAYLASKVPREMPVTKWDADVAAAWLDEEESALVAGDHWCSEGSLKARRLSISDLRDDLAQSLRDRSEHEFVQALYESGWLDGCDWPNLTAWTPSFLWCREALVWWMAHMKE